MLSELRCRIDNVVCSSEDSCNACKSLRAQSAGRSIRYLDSVGAGTTGAEHHQHGGK